MSLTPIQLPEDPVALARLLRNHADRSELRAMPRRTAWLLAWYYLNGARRFDTYDPTSGILTPYYVDDTEGGGRMPFQNQELLSQLDRIQASLSSMDILPRVVRDGLSLPRLRDQAIAQILLDSSLSATDAISAQGTFVELFTLLGCCGIASHLIEGPSAELFGELEVIHPRELYPFPALGQDITAQRGLMRVRYVPMSYLKDRFGAKIARNESKLFWYERTIGEPLSDVAAIPSIGSPYAAPSLSIPPPNRSGSVPQGKDVGKDRMGVVKLIELWLDGPRGTCSRYIVSSGDVVLKDESYSGLNVYCPIGMARFMRTATFHGLGAFDLLFPLNRQVEKLLESLYNNVLDTDRYGFLVIPRGAFNEQTMFRDVGRGLRLATYEPDVMGNDFRPFNVQPFNLGDVPGKTAAFTRQILQDLSPVRDLADEKGRIDSAVGLQALAEDAARAITTPTTEMSRAFGVAYRNLARATAGALKTGPRAVPINRLSMDLAGAVIDFRASAAVFPENPLPDISSLTFSIRQTTPRSAATRKMEAMQLYSTPLGAPDPTSARDDFILFCIKEGHDPAMWIDPERAAYDSEVRLLLQIYNDGKTPGKAATTPALTNARLQLKLALSFMASPACAVGVASPSVINELQKHRLYLMQQLGIVLPPGVPTPEDSLIPTSAAGPPTPAAITPYTPPLHLSA